jgi:cation:H+ antiporter
MLISILLIVVGIAILIYGADILVKWAGSLSKIAGVPTIVIGLTVVAFGTSAPELVVNLTAAVNGKTDIAIGNIIGSNTVNILLILGLSALITTLKAKKSTTWKEVPFAFLAILVVFFLWNDIWLGQGESDVLTAGDGLVLVCFFAIFMYYIFALSKNSELKKEEADEIVIYGKLLSISYIVFGLIGLFIGGKMFVSGASDLALALWLSELLIGLTIVAVGTSLPELATSIIAARRNQSDIAIGNIVGSNIFNVFWILGVTAIIHPIPLNSGMNIDIVVSLISAFLLFVFLFFRNKHELGKIHWYLFIALYIAYTVYLVIRG